MQENGLKAEGQITKNTKSIICILLGNTHSFYENLTGKYKECIFQNMAVKSSSQDQYATQRPQRDHKPKAACNEVCSGPPLCTCVEQHYQVPQSVRKFSLVHFYQQVQLRQGQLGTSILTYKKKEKRPISHLICSTQSESDAGSHDSHLKKPQKNRKFKMQNSIKGMYHANKINQKGHRGNLDGEEGI